MFELKLHGGGAGLLRKALLAFSNASDYTLFNISSDEVFLMSPRRGQLQDFTTKALLRIRNPPTDVAVITCDAPAALLLNLSELIHKLTPAGDENDDVVLTFHGRDGKVPEDSVGFQFAKPGSGTFAELRIPIVDDQTAHRISIPTFDNKYKTIIGIPAGDFIRLVIKLNYFDDNVSIRATKTEVKFSATNEEVILRTQPGGNPETAECTIEGIQDADIVSFSFSLRHRQTIINTCKLSGIARLLHYDDLTSVLNCTVGRLGNMVLFLDWL